MKILTKFDQKNLLLGTMFLGTGGGGSPLLAKNILNKINSSIFIKPITDFLPNDVFITTYTVGGLKQDLLKKRVLTQALADFKKITNFNIRGIIPVEIGPLSVALAAKLASILNLPLVDADFVGGRSTPEVFLETITLANIKRTPMIVINNNFDEAMLINSSNYMMEENFLRGFAALSGGFACVLGYPIKQSIAKKVLTGGTLTKAVCYGQALSQNKLSNILKLSEGKVLFEGKISKISNMGKGGFTEKIVFFTNNKQNAKLYLKNENLVFWINSKVKLTCPELLILLDKNLTPVYNLDLKKGLKVKVIGLPSEKIWRTKSGLNLFNPRLFGFKFNPKLI